MYFTMGCVPSRREARIMGEMLARWLFSFAAACYIVAALTLLPQWIRAQHLSNAEQWIAYLAAEAIALGALVVFSLWLLFSREGLRLTFAVLAPLFALLVIPAGCFIFIQGVPGTIAGTGIFAFSLGALVLVNLAARRPRD